MGTTHLFNTTHSLKKWLTAAYPNIYNTKKWTTF